MAGTATGHLGALDIGVRAVTAEVMTAGGAAANVIGLPSEVAVELGEFEPLPAAA
jgi:hypothetical protein